MQDKDSIELNKIKVFLRKKRKFNKIKKTTVRTARNKLLKEKYKKARRIFLRTSQDNKFEAFKTYISYIGKLKKHGIINGAKSSRLQHKVSKKCKLIN